MQHRKNVGQALPRERSPSHDRLACAVIRSQEIFERETACFIELGHGSSRDAQMSRRFGQDQARQPSLANSGHDRLFAVASERVAERTLKKPHHRAPTSVLPEAHDVLRHGSCRSDSKEGTNKSTALPERARETDEECLACIA